MANANSTEYASLLATAIAAAEAGGRELIHWQGKFETREKARADLVTDADLAAQRAVAEIVQRDFPDHAFLGEEDSLSLVELLDEPVCWVVDPLDGTTNYVHGFPAFVVSVAVVVEGCVVAGVLLDPVRNRTFAAMRGGGATCNGEPLKVSETTDLSQALVAMSLPAEVQKDSPELADFVEIVGQCHGVRRTGSSAMNLACVTEGVLDSYWARRINAWDIAAGVLLVEEAGGVITAADGGELNLAKPTVLASANRRLHDQMLEVLNRPAGAV